MRSADWGAVCGFVMRFVRHFVRGRGEVEADFGERTRDL